MQTGYICDPGKKRKLNEDSVLCVRLDTESNSMAGTSGLFIVADGMGGHNAGEVASELAARETARACLAGLPGLVNEFTSAEHAADNQAKVLSLAVSMANKTIHDLSKKEKLLHGMGSTIVAALISGQDLYVTNVGDSRCYIINRNEIIQITRDHSLAKEMAEAGLITSEESRTHPRKNVLTHVVGYEEKVEDYSCRYKLFQDDNIVLCSDGLWGVLTDGQIQEIVLSADGPQQACISLAALANELGGPDNISAIVVKPEKLPVRKELLDADTQVKMASGLTEDASPKQRKGIFSFFSDKISNK